MSRTKSANAFGFDILNTAGEARAGQLHVNGTRLETPNFYPVMNFYAGGTERSVFGGGVYRTLKELMIGAERVETQPLNEYFDAMMMSISSLTDYNITHERFQSYLDTPIKERKMFSPVTGQLFLDSGGFKLLSNAELDGSNFSVELNQQSVFEIQRALGGDIIVNLDHPISPDDSRADRLDKAEKTASNIHEFLSLTRDFDGALFLTVHGYNYSMLSEYMDTITNSVAMGILREGFDGIALGSLVPKKDNRPALIKAVRDCRELMGEWDIAHWPLHILGIASRAIPILALLGADTFDSSTHIHNAINGKYNRSMMESVSLDEANFSDCDCPVCQSDHLVNWMRGNTEYQKDILGPVAMHNLIIQKRELAALRSLIQTGEEQELIEYLEETFGQDKTMRQYAHQIVNETLGGYF